MSSQPILRIAPSPNGHLHLGHAYSALKTRQWADELGGKLLLRIEDIDTARCKPEFTAQVIDDLRWLGITWQEPVLHQSTRMAHYERAAGKLRDMGLLYPCFCSRSEIAGKAGQTDPDGAPLYPGTCRHLDEEEVGERLERGDPVQYRLATDIAHAATGVLTYTVAAPTPLDRPQIRYARPERWGDVVLQRKDTPTSYHLSVVVDDAAQHITHVTRGKDMEAATDIHVLLQFLLGLAAPVYTFHKLILDDDGQKLSKSNRSLSLKTLREQGWSATQVREQLGL